MGQRFTIAGRIVRFRFFAFLIVILGSAVFLFLHLQPEPVYKFAKVQYGKVTTSHQGSALVIRQEEVFTAPEYGKVIYYASDGDSVSKENLLASIYKSEYQVDLIYQLYNIQGQILRYQKNSVLAEAIDADLENISQQILKTLSDIQDDIKDSNIKELDKQEKSLRILLENAQKLIDKKVVPDQYLTELYKKEALLNKQLSDWKIDIIAPKTGLVSFYTDIFNEILCYETADIITLQEFRDIMQAETQGSIPGEAVVDQPFFRIVDPLKWYVACEIADDNIFYKEGDEVDVQFSEFPDITLHGKVYRRIDDKSSHLFIIEMTSELSSFINIRQTWIEIRKTFEGVLVPLNAVFEQHGDKGVKILNGSTPEFRSVNIKAFGIENAIIEEKDSTQKLEINTPVLTR